MGCAKVTRVAVVVVAVVVVISAAVVFVVVVVVVVSQMETVLQNIEIKEDYKLSGQLILGQGSIQ